ncbi:hypothetical protein CKO28_00555 [Rhodovibrio sodomensis]|uniref:Peptidase S8/S53 domain-containing protein n=1 Tax=Rhodovibrio sodomensis TaxID=1088 RepID=A0ABS1D9G1_9PROT|nr:S8 family peptidase [Rhodovibrio sodomensis]MBK1666531.1 hypothetical protein [Rhodovibrio sodomensis]
MSRTPRSLLVALLSTTALTLAACGGGGGGAGSQTSNNQPVTGSTPSPSDPLSAPFSKPTTPAHFETSEYDRAQAFDQINASHAYAAGLTGEGVLAAVIDTGLDSSHTEFTGAITEDIHGRGANTYGDLHGHEVMGLLGARKNDSEIHGVAYDADLLSIRADDPGSCGGSGCQYQQADLATATDLAKTYNPRVINYSMGGDDGSGTLDASFRTALVNAAQPSVDGDGNPNGSVLVFAAGNESYATPSDLAHFAADADAQGRGIIVGAVDSSNAIASFSNRAGPGDTQNWFIVAPGEDVVTTTAAPNTLAVVDGTSFAAPQVAGAAAILAQSFPYLRGDEIVQILLDTAQDLGTAGVDATYGHGLLDLEAAMNPSGTPLVPAGSSVNDGGAKLAASALSPSSAFGKALQQANALKQAAFIDKYGRAFQVDLTAGIGAGQAAPMNFAHIIPGFGPNRVSAGDRVGEGWMHFSERTGFTTRSELSQGHIPGQEQGGQSFAFNQSYEDLNFSFGHGVSLQSLRGGPDAAEELGMGTDLASPYLGFATGEDVMATIYDRGHGLFAGFATSEGGHDGTAQVGTIGYTFQDGTRLTLDSGSLIEGESLLGSYGQGAFDFGTEGQSRFMGLRLDMPMSRNWLVSASYHRGVTEADNTGHGLWRGTTAIQSEAFGVAVAGREVFREGDSLGFGISRPLKIVSGAANVSVPVGRGADGEIIREDHQIGLSPDGNQVDLEVSYATPLSENSSLRMGLMGRLQPGHDRDAAPEAGAAVSYQITW